MLFTPADEADLADFLKATPGDVPVYVIGVGSNLLVRDGGVPGVVIRLGKGFAGPDAGAGPSHPGRSCRRWTCASPASRRKMVSMR